MSGLEKQSVASLALLNLIELGREVNHLVGTTPTVLVNPNPGKNKLVLAPDSGEFRIRLGDQIARVFTAADFANDNLTIAAHNYQTGDGPYQVSSVGTLPAGLAATTDYWTIRTGDNTFRLATSKANALAGTQVVITDAGTGAHTISGLYNVSEAPSANVTDGTGGIKLSTGQSLTLPGPELITVVGFDAGDILTYFYV